MTDIQICQARIRPFLDSERLVGCYHVLPHDGPHEGVWEEIPGERIVVRWEIK